RIPGLQYADHVAFTVPDLDEAVGFFVEALGAEELYRSTRGPDPVFMPENFDAPQDAALTLAMLRMPPNLNVELFEWSGSDRPRVAGNRWSYFLTPWGLLMELVDRSRVSDPPALVGPADWLRAANET